MTILAQNHSVSDNPPPKVNPSFAGGSLSPTSLRATFSERAATDGDRASAGLVKSAISARSSSLTLKETQTKNIYEAVSPGFCPSAKPLGSDYESTLRSDGKDLEQLRKRAKRRVYRLLSLAQKLLPEARVSDCYRGGDGDGRLMHSASVGHAWIEGVYVCGDVWACPVCSQRISMKRTDELREALAAAAALGWFPVLMTATVQHERADELAELVESFNKAFSRLKGVRCFEKIKARLGYKGDITGLESPYGFNGWHPHKHCILLFDHKLTSDELAQLRSDLAEEWPRRLQAVGLDASYEHGIDVENADEKIAEYVAKFGREPAGHWGLADEVGRSIIKRGRRGSLSPFQLLEVYGLDVQSREFRQFADVINSPRHAGRLFVEYAKAMKNKHQLDWSRGLKAALGLKEPQTDAELAEPEKVNDAVQLVTFGKETKAYLSKHVLWADFIIAGGHGDRRAVIDWMNAHGLHQVDLSQFDMPPLKRSNRSQGHV